ncbi:MAG: response regulator [Bacteroidota bacterium]
MDNWLAGVLWHESDTQVVSEQKFYLARNSLLAGIILVLVFIPLVLLRKFQILLVISPLLIAIILTVSLLVILKRAIKWLLYSYYVAYIIICCLIVLEFGGLPWSCGAWGGAFICLTLALGIKNKTVIVVSASVYAICLVIIATFYPWLTPYKQLTPELNNLFFTINEVWMCLFLIKSFYESIIVRTNEASRRAVHFQELDILKSKMYANITHEFRTPLTLIRGNAEEISEHVVGKSAEKAKHIVQNSGKILFLVNQMLNLSKIEEGHMPMHYRQFDLVEFVRLIVGNFQGLADFRRIRIHFEPHVDRLMMDIEREMLGESLSNLLSNAIQTTPEGGDIFVTIRRPGGSKKSVQPVEISVKVTGPEISESELDKIFIRFYRVENDRIPNLAGIGIGLALVKEYFRLMKGTIEVKSSSGVGSEFVITLPVTQHAGLEELVSSVHKLTEKVESCISKPEISGSIPNHPLLLVIEDNPELREYLHGLLRNEYQVLTAEDGVRGTEMAREHLPEIILSDVMMPGKDGFQVCRELKNDFLTSHIPIVLLTARSDTGSRITGMEQGADAYLTKPFNKRELLMCLQNILVQRETLRLKFCKAFEKEIDEQEHGLNGRFLNSVIGHLERNYQNDWYGIHQLYADLNISRAQLHRKLTALTGQPASCFIRNFRLHKAKRLLLETDKPVSDIAFEVGFSDANYFSKAFVQEFGVASSEWRKSIN